MQSQQENKQLPLCSDNNNDVKQNGLVSGDSNICRNAQTGRKCRYYFQQNVVGPDRNIRILHAILWKGVRDQHYIIKRFDDLSEGSIGMRSVGEMIVFGGSSQTLNVE